MPGRVHVESIVIIVTRYMVVNHSTKAYYYSHATPSCYSQP